MLINNVQELKEIKFKWEPNFPSNKNIKGKIYWENKNKASIKKKKKICWKLNQHPTNDRIMLWNIYNQ